MPFTLKRIFIYNFARMQQLFITACLCLLSFFSFAQAGGNGTYAFLDLPPSARGTALGGNVLHIKDHDLNNAFQNPALLNREMDHAVAFNTMNYLSDINYGYAAYGKDAGKAGTFGIGMLYVNYGDFTAADETGSVTGTFTASEYAFNAGWGRQYDRHFSYGVNLKGIVSHLESYRSSGIATDIGGSYADSASSFCAGLVLKNIGTQLSTYVPGHKEPLPFEIQAGISKRLKHAPFRYSIVLHNLQKFDLTYTDPDEQAQEVDLVTGEPIKKEAGFANKAARHVIIGVEALLSKNFSLRAAYNHQKRKELAIDEKGSTVGFSWGFGLRIKKISLSYGSARYHLAGSTNQFSIALNLNDFIKSRN